MHGRRFLQKKLSRQTPEDLPGQLFGDWRDQSSYSDLELFLPDAEFLFFDPPQFWAFLLLLLLFSDRYPLFSVNVFLVFDAPDLFLLLSLL